MERLKNRCRVTRTHTHTLALRSLCCSQFPASFEHTVKTNSILMTTQEQVKSETSPVSTHPRSVNLTSPMLRTKSLCYKVLVPETCTDVAILHANTKTKTCTPRQSLHAPIQDISTISKNKASVLDRNLDASPPRFPVKNREHGGGYGASRNWINRSNRSPTRLRFCLCVKTDFWHHFGLQNCVKIC